VSREGERDREGEGGEQQEELSTAVEKKREALSLRYR
jgi:hypothetical protein